MRWAAYSLESVCTTQNGDDNPSDGGHKDLGKSTENAFVTDPVFSLLQEQKEMS